MHILFYIMTAVVALLGIAYIVAAIQVNRERKSNESQDIRKWS